MVLRSFAAPPISLAASSTDRKSNGSCRDIVPTNGSRRLNLGLDGMAMPGKTCLYLPRRLSFARWQNIGYQLAVIVDTTAWWLGDWLVYGQDHYDGRYKEAIERTSLEYQTLRNYAWVARAFNVSRRRDTLSFAHHAEVAGLTDPEQDFWLRTAANSRWSRNRLRAELKTSLNGRCHRTLPDDSQGAIGCGEEKILRLRTLVLRLSADQFQRFERAADADNGNLEEWAILVLERVSENSPADSA